MTPDQLRHLKTGDNVTRPERGRVTQLTPTWFMVVWQNGEPEIIKRADLVAVQALHLEPAPRDRERGHSLYSTPATAPRAYKDD